MMVNERLMKVGNELTDELCNTIEKLGKSQMQRVSKVLVTATQNDYVLTIDALLRILNGIKGKIAPCTRKGFSSHHRTMAICTKNLPVIVNSLDSAKALDGVVKETAEEVADSLARFVDKAKALLKGKPSHGWFKRVSQEEILNWQAEQILKFAPEIASDLLSYVCDQIEFLESMKIPTEETKP